MHNIVVLKIEKLSPCKLRCLVTFHIKKIKITVCELDRIKVNFIHSFGAKTILQ